MLKGFFLCDTSHSSLLQELSPELNELIGTSLEQKILHLELELTNIIPLSEELGEGLSPLEFAASFLRQPLLFLRVRPNKMAAVIEKMSNANLLFEQLTPACVALPNASSIEKVLLLNKEVVVQDFNSQRVFDFLQTAPSLLENGKKMVWDCCAASGGKSILLFDRLEGQIQLTVSDIRKSILHNLQERLALAKVPIYKKMLANLEEPLPPDRLDDFDLIICDVPCTGSGTWSRTPEQLAYFKNEAIDQYARRQNAIASNAANYLKPGGLLFYITCSVFKKENETVVQSLLKDSSLKLLNQQYLQGYEMQADTMFVAVLQSTVIAQ